MLAKQIAAELRCGWVSTDMLLAVLRAKNVEGAKHQWDASSESIRSAADWFYPCLQTFVHGASTFAEHYVIEGVDFLPRHAAALAESHPLRAIFLGRSSISLPEFDDFGRSAGYGSLPPERRERMARDIPPWSRLVCNEAERFGFPYVDTADDFAMRLGKARAALLES
jgi:hypothetical protein